MIIALYQLHIKNFSVHVNYKSWCTYTYPYTLRQSIFVQAQLYQLQQFAKFSTMFMFI